MIHVNPSLFLQRLIITSHTGAVAYDLVFHKGVNIIRGQNSSGKSTIANFIFYALGGDYNNWTTEAVKCQDVFAEVLLNDAVVTLKRVVTPNVHQPMSIYWGKYEDGLKNLAAWHTYPYRQAEGRISFSRVLFNTLGFPEVRIGDTDSNITMHQILRLMYIDQDTPIQSLFRDEKFDPPLVRQTTAEILLGIYEDSLYNDRVNLRNLEKSYGEKKSQYDGIRRVYSQSGGEISVLAIEKEIENGRAELVDVENDLSKLKEKRRINITKKTVLQYEAINTELSAVKALISKTVQDLQTIEVDIFDSNQFIVTLQNRIKEIDFSLLTRRYLGELPLTHCPNCLAPLPEALAGHCLLCTQPLSDEEERSAAKKLKQEMEMQVMESKSLLEEKERIVSQLKGALPAYQERAHILQKDLNKAVEESQSTRDDRIDALLVKKGSVEQKIAHQIEQLKAANLLKQLRDEMAEIAGRIDTLKRIIIEKERGQESKLQAALQSIQAYTLGLLKKDLPRQNEFKTGRVVEINFSKDTFALDGSNNFSASSKIYFKNSLIYSIFFSSLRFDFFRYPRFVLCDNMEDKGMEKERSQNFQKLIVDLSTQHEVEHQIIFTTSMIADELNNTDLCVGEFYSDTNKTLKL